jgi:hypothetical protein
MVARGYSRLNFGFIFLPRHTKQVAVECNKIENAGRAQRDDRGRFSALHQLAFDNEKRSVEGRKNESI